MIQQLRTRLFDAVPRGLNDWVAASRFIWRYRTHPEALESVLAALRAGGAPEADVARVRELFESWRTTFHDTEPVFRLDSYLLAGAAALDLVLVPVIIPMGVPDRALLWAEVFLVTSLVLVSACFFVNYVKRAFGKAGYGWQHSIAMFLAPVSGGGALIATVWRQSLFVGIYLLVLAIAAYVVCTAYFISAQWGDVWRTFRATTSALARSAQARADASPSTNESGEPAA